VLNEKVRPIIEPFTSAAGRAIARAHVSPNMLTAAGLLGSLFCAWLIVVHHPGAAGETLIPFVIIDVLDGATARATGRITKFGAFFDSVSDRIGDGALLAAILIAHSHSAKFRWAVLVALILTMLVPYARAKAEALGYSVASGPGERAERVVILIAGLVLRAPALLVTVWIIAALTAITFVSRFAMVWRQARV
jgi:CDP-diacylglycerol--glycerol-3-phosphate 3-phosphatidyltransferase